MELTETHILKDNRFMDLCVKSKNLYNQSLYYWRQSIFGNIECFTEYELTGLFAKFKEPTYKALPAQTSQQVIKLLFKNIKSWQNARKEYNKNPLKFKGKPRIPKYKKHTFVTLFTKQEIRIEQGLVIFPNLANIPSIKTNQKNIKYVRIVPHINHCSVDIVYSMNELDEKRYNEEWMGIDIGVNNIVSCITPKEGFIINGKPLKSTNHYYNKRRKYLQSKLKNTYKSNKISKITHKRNNRIKDYLHKVSRIVVNNANRLGVTKIIIGQNKNWKQNVNLGKRNNYQFVSIPHATLIEMIKYKAQMIGINTIIVCESYTSKCSALDLEPIKKHNSYLGKRKKRGLFVTKEGSLINADMNGALNIARVGLKNVVGNEIFISDSIRCCVLQPKKIII